MGLFKCRGCEARDQEIKHLMAQLERLSSMLEKSNARVTELAEPGIERRLVPHVPQVGDRPRRQKPLVDGFPGYGMEPKLGPQVEIDQ